MTLDCSPYTANKTISQQIGLQTRNQEINKGVHNDQFLVSVEANTKVENSNQLFGGGTETQQLHDDPDDQSNHQLQDDDYMNSFEDQVNQIVASPNQDSFFMDEDMPSQNQVRKKQGQTEFNNQSEFKLQAMGQNLNQYEEESKSSPKQQHLQQQQLQLNESRTTDIGSLGETINNTNPKNQQQNNKPQSFNTTNMRSLQVSKNSAFQVFNKQTNTSIRNDQVQQTNQSNARCNYSVLNDEEQKSQNNNLFAISDSILMMLTDDNDQEESQNKKQNDKPQRSEQNLLLRLTKKLVDTIQICNPGFNYQPIMNPKRDLTIPSEGVLNNGYDNLDNDYILRVGDYIITPENREYEIQDLMGKGTFGQVVKCQCRQGKELVAIKVIKNKKAFKNQGVIEIKILDILNRVYDPNGEMPIVRMLDFFVFRNHLCIVFELLSTSLFDLLKENNFNGISLNFSRLIISKILEGMKVIKDARLVHCDLKPENILFKTKNNMNIKIIDLGSACFEGFDFFHYIQSRFYRSPEVLLGLPYDSSIDMWSLGCICAELFLGIPIFPGNSEYDQLARIIKILGVPSQHLIAKARFRDKYFVFNPETMQYRFKTFEEYQITMNIRLEIPREYNKLRCLDDLKIVFIQKKRLQQYNQIARDPHFQNAQNFQPKITESEMNTMDAFIDFLKGVLRIDKDNRWTPSMAMGHPFITRDQYSNPYEPLRDNEIRSTSDTADDSNSNQKQSVLQQQQMSNSSKDSREYKAGSCPSKILYPQTATLPQYLQNQQPGFQNPPSQQFPQNFPGNQYVFHGINSNIQSHRPPILSIPEEYFKGFMFSRLDQILSMTREQLLQFVYEQNEIAFRQQQAQKMHMMQQQQLIFQQQQQMMMNYQQIMIQQNPPQIQNPQSFQQPQNQMFPQNRPSFGQPIMNQGFNMNPNQIFMDQNALNQQQIDQQRQGLNQIPNLNQQQTQIAIGGGQFISGPPPNQQAFMQQLPPHQMMMPQKMVMTNEQIIFNPPPYQMQKNQLQNAAQFNDPNYNEAMQQQKAQAFRNRQGGNQGKPGSWQPPQGIEKQKYNHYYNQINNPGQIIGRPNQIGDFQQQFIHQNQKIPGLSQANHHDKSDNSKVGSFNTNDFKKLKEKKSQGMKSSGYQFANNVIIEENQQDQHSNSDKGQHEVPFPSAKQFLPVTTDANQYQQKDQYFPLFQDNFAQNSQFHQQQVLENQYKMINPAHQIGGSIPMKQFPSPKISSDQNSFIMNQKVLQQQNQATHSRNQSLNNLPIDGTNTNQSLNNSFSQQSVGNVSLNSSMSGSSKSFLKKFEQQTANNQQQINPIGGIGGVPDQQKNFINNNHHYHSFRGNDQQQTSHLKQSGAPFNMPQHVGIGANLNYSMSSYRQRSDSDQIITDESAPIT